MPQVSIHNKALQITNRVYSIWDVLQPDLCQANETNHLDCYCIIGDKRINQGDLD